MNTIDQITNFFEAPKPEYGFPTNACENLGSFMVHPAISSLRYLNSDRKDIELVKAVTAVALIIITTPITLVGTALFLIGRVLPKKYEPVTDQQLIAEGKLHCYPKEMNEQNYLLLQYLHEVCQELGISYTCMSGTLLGQLRSGGIIPWDDDIDVGMMEEVVGLHRDEIKKKLEDRGVDFLPRPGLIQLQFSRKARNHFWAGSDQVGQLDIFSLRHEPENKRVFFSSEILRAQCAGEYFSDDILDDQHNLRVKEDRFGPITAYVPNDRQLAEGYVKHYYGDDCLEYGLYSHRHVKLPLPECLFGTVMIPVPALRKDKFRIIVKV